MSPEPDRPHRPIFGFATGSAILTADGPKRMEDIKPGDMIQVQLDDGQRDREPHTHEERENGDIVGLEKG